jgi:hypothetical protein
MIPGNFKYNQNKLYPQMESEGFTKLFDPLSCAPSSTWVSIDEYGCTARCEAGVSVIGLESRI